MHGRTLRLVLALTLVAGLLPWGAAGAASKNPKMRTLGTDEANDAPPGADLLALQAGVRGKELVVRIVMDQLPELTSYPGSGIQWSFSTGGRIFVVEAHPDFGEGRLQALRGRGRRAT